MGRTSMAMSNFHSGLQSCHPERSLLLRQRCLRTDGPTRDSRPGELVASTLSSLPISAVQCPQCCDDIRADAAQRRSVVSGLGWFLGDSVSRVQTLEVHHDLGGLRRHQVPETVEGPFVHRLSDANLGEQHCQQICLELGAAEGGVASLTWLTC